MFGTIQDLYRTYEEALPHADPRTRNWLLLNNSPIYVLVVSSLYLLFVWLGPKLMHNRKPLKLQWFMIAYNFGLVALSVYMVVEMVLSSWAAGYNYICQPLNAKTIKNPKELRVAQVLWWYFFSKAIEFMDTVLMILRKKNNQVSFLHVFHHWSMLNIWWWIMMFIPGGQALVGSCLNTVVHVVMYFYYGLAVFPSLKEKLWWKKYLTTFQLIQFSVIIVHSSNTFVSGCDFPYWGAYLLSGYMVLMITLFGNFYFHTYTKRTRGKTMKDRNSNDIVNGSNSNDHVRYENMEKKLL